MTITRGVLGTMTKKAGRPKKVGVEGLAVRIDRDIAMMAKATANHRGSTIGEYLSALLRTDVIRDYGKTLREIEAVERGAK